VSKVVTTSVQNHSARCQCDTCVVDSAGGLQHLQEEAAEKQR
jgi:hypothetical protein